MLIAVAALSVGSLATLAAGAPDGAIVGYVSDTKCAMSASKAKSAAEWIKPAAFEECVKSCVKDGSAAVFVTEDNKILTFDKASVAKITPFLGRKVSVTGNVKGGTVTVDQITGLKM
jgi:hypothetical protein